jgi:hypothetical protein
MQQLSAPVHSRLRENTNFRPSGAGAFFAVEIEGNESGGGWRARDDNRLPSAGNERVLQAQVLPKKYYHLCTFSGLAEAVSQRGGEDAFASGVTYAISQAVRRAGANQETTFLRGDGTGRLANSTEVETGQISIAVTDARTFRSGQVIEFLNNTTGVRVDGPVTVVSRDVAGNSITVSSAVTLAGTEGIYIYGEQSGAAAPVEITALGLPKLVNNAGTIYGLNRTAHPILQSKVLGSAGVLDESMLRRLRKRLMIETAVESLEGFVMISNHDQYDRYTEIALPFRRFPDMRLELGAQQELTTFEGRPWLVTWAALPDEIYMINLAAIERGVVRPLSIDERVNMQWIPGQDSFAVLLKTYCENVGRYLNQTSVIRGLSIPAY